jgi:probable phosphoglycerate mutase
LLQIYLIRHGETAWSLSGQHTGATDIPLTAHGEDEARALGQRLQGIAFAHVLSSPMQRARRTCELAAPGAHCEIVQDLSEWSYGAYEGRTSADIQRIRPGWELWRDGCPDGESPQAVSGRADRLIERVGALTGNVALFAHGHVGCAFAARWIGLDVAQGRHLMLDPASISILGYPPRHPETRVIALWNETRVRS